MSFLKKLKKKLVKVAAKGISLYGKVGIGPGSGLAAKASPLVNRLVERHKQQMARPGESIDSMGHNRRALLRRQGIGHNRASMLMMQQRGYRRAPRRAPRRRRVYA